eukprot:g6981.t1
MYLEPSPTVSSILLEPMCGPATKHCSAGDPVVVNCAGDQDSTGPALTAKRPSNSVAQRLNFTNLQIVGARWLYGTAKHPPFGAALQVDGWGDGSDGLPRADYRVVFDRCRFADNVARGGGAVDVYPLASNLEVAFIACEFTHNTALGAGDPPDENFPHGNGGAVTVNVNPGHYTLANVSLRWSGCTFDGNEAIVGYGGAVNMELGTKGSSNQLIRWEGLDVGFDGCTFTNNSLRGVVRAAGDTAVKMGGAVAVSFDGVEHAQDTTVRFDGTRFENNSATHREKQDFTQLCEDDPEYKSPYPIMGGAVSVSVNAFGDEPSVLATQFRNCTFVRNTACSAGGAIRVASSLRLYNSLYGARGNWSTTTDISDCEFTDNVAYGGDGGGAMAFMFLEDQTANLKFVGNETAWKEDPRPDPLKPFQWDPAYLDHPCRFCDEDCSNCGMLGNHPLGNAYSISGSALIAPVRYQPREWVYRHHVVVQNSVVKGNIATSRGGGLSMPRGGNATITGCSFTNNRVLADASSGGGLSIGGTAKLALWNSTVHGNICKSHGCQVYSDSGVVAIVIVVYKKRRTAWAQFPVFKIAVGFFEMIAVMNESVDVAWPASYRKFVSARLFFIAFFCYPLVAPVIVSIFICRTVDGASYLEADYTIRCDSKYWKRAVSWSALWTAAYLFGFPLVMYKPFEEEAHNRLEFVAL